MSRADVIARCASAFQGPDGATRAFITAMIWGYGTVGYGAFRTKRILAENDDVGDTLATVARIALDEGGPAAFAWLAKPEHRLRWLGVAFATKYLFFCAANGPGEPALVLDRLVRRWIFVNLDWTLSLDWDVADYREYVEVLCSWADELDLEAGNLEMLVFQLAANSDPRSLWSAPELFASSATEAAAPTAELAEESAEVVEMLNEAEARFASLPGGIGPDDMGDFERGVRDLKRIILARL